MASVIVDMRMSLDGFVADRTGDSSRLYPDIGEMPEGEMLTRTGAVVMGRRAYDMAEGDFTGYEYQLPLFVVTHEAPKEVAKGENEKLSFTFVTDGIESAIAQAKAAAGDKHVTIIGGASTAQQALKGGLVDEIQVQIAPLLLGEGLRLFEEGAPEMALERLPVVESPTRPDARFRVLSAD